MKTEQEKKSRIPWDVFIEETLRGVRRRGLRLFAMGFLVYAGGGAAILFFVSNPVLAAWLQSILFPLCIMYASMMEVFPCVRGAFLTSLEASNRSVPVMEDMGSAANKLTEAVEKNEGDGDIVERLERAGDRVVARMQAAMREGLKWELPDPDAHDPLLDGEIIGSGIPDLRISRPSRGDIESESPVIRELEHEHRGIVGSETVRPDTETRAFPAVSLKGT